MPISISLMQYDMHLPIFSSASPPEEKKKCIRMMERKKGSGIENVTVNFYVKNIFTSLTRGKEYDMYKGITYI